MKAVGVTWPPIEVETQRSAGNRRWLRLLLAGAAETFFFVGLLAAVGLVTLGLALLLLPLAATVVLGAAWLLQHRPRIERPRLRAPRPQASLRRPARAVAHGAAAVAHGAAATAQAGQRLGHGAATRVRPIASAGL